MKKIKNFIKKLINFKKKEEFSEKKYIKDLILKKRKDNIPLEAGSLSIEMGTSKEFMINLLNEINLEEKEKEKQTNLKKVKKIKEVKKKDYFKNLMDEQDEKTLKELLLKIILFGVPINLSIYILIFKPFTFYSWFAYGYFFWILKKEVIPILRGLIHK